MFLLIHLIVTIAKLLLPGGARSIIAESLLLKHQLLILNRSRARAPNLRPFDRVIAGLCNCGRPHSALGPGVPDPPVNLPVPLSPARHRLDNFRSVHANPILGGLHHEYSLARAST